MLVAPTLTETKGPTRALLGVLAACVSLAFGPGCKMLPHRDGPRGDYGAAPKPTSQTPLAQNSAIPSAFGKPLSPEQQLKVHLDLAHAAEAQEDIESSLDQYQKALNSVAPGTKGLKPVAAQTSRALVHRRMAATLDRNGQFEQSEAQYKQALKEAPNDAKAWNDLGYSYYLQGKWEQAQQALSRAAELDPTDKRALTNLGLAKAAAGDVKGAFEVLSKAGSTASAHMNIGYVLAALGKSTEAREHFREALRIQPSLKTASMALARVDQGPARRDPNVAVVSAPGVETARKVEKASREAAQAR